MKKLKHYLIPKKINNTLKIRQEFVTLIKKEIILIIKYN
jgi:hypothetical protein